MRQFTQLVFDGNITGTTPVMTSEEFAELLGRADELVVETEVDVAAGTTPTITVEVFHSNSGKAYIAATSGTLVNAASLASAYRSLVKYDAEPLGSLVQLRITLGGTTPVARVRIWVCGRGKK